MGQWVASARRLKLNGHLKGPKHKKSKRRKIENGQVEAANGPTSQQYYDCDAKLYCYCQEFSEGNMIECDNPDVSCPSSP